MIQSFLLAAWLLVLAGVVRGATGSSALPNIVIIVAGDLGYGDVQGLNPVRGRIPTPAVDRLAREGLVFTDAHSGSSVCTPTRYGLLTGEPFLLYFAQTSPHTPIVPSASWKGGSGLGDYGDFVMETDGSVAEMLKALERQGHFASAQVRGYKSDIWECGHRVPFIVRWPGKMKAGVVTPVLVGLNDLMVTATFAELADIRHAETVAEDSVSFLDGLLGRTETERDSLVHHSISGKFAVRPGPWKLALTSGSGGWSKDVTEGPLQLHNLAEDEGETTNLAARHPAKVAELKALLGSIVDRGRSTPGPALRNDAPVEWREANQDPIVL